MTRLIDADALLEEIGNTWEYANPMTIVDLISNAPTVQREGWVSVPIEPVAWKRTRKSNGESEYFTDREYKHEALFDWIPLYAAQTDTE